MEDNKKIKSFPLSVLSPWLDRLGRAVKKSGAESKHEFIIEAVDEKMNRVLGSEETK